MYMFYDIFFEKSFAKNIFLASFVEHILMNWKISRNIKKKFPIES